MKKFKAYNFPKDLSLKHFKECNDLTLKQLIKYYPESEIYKLGGKHLNPGISDIDFLIVSKEVINGNHLYLRNFPKVCLNTGILVHEPFAVDKSTFKWIKRLTSYELELVYEAENEIHSDTKPLDANKIHDLLKLVQYLVVNYPMNFIEYLNDRNINVRRSISKLKKLLLIEKLFRSVFEINNGTLDESFKAELIELTDNHSSFSRDELKNKVRELLNDGVDQLKNIYSEYESRSTEQFNLNLGNGFLRFKNYNIEFSDNWKQNLYQNDIYYMPRNLGIINTLFLNIEENFLKNIRFSKPDVHFDEGDTLSVAINDYLKYCNESKLLTLIFDIDFSVKGHDSLKYRVFRVLSWFKTNLYSRINPV